MGKKRKEVVEEEPPEFATENEKKKTRSANYSQLSTETLLVKEQEATQNLVKLQAELERMRTNIGIHYRSDPLRQMNTKRYRAEYALGEIKAEIQRRARRKMGQDMPAEGIHSGSMSGIIATTISNTSHAKTRETSTACSGILADDLKKQREKQEADKRNQRSGGGSANVFQQWQSQMGPEMQFDTSASSSGPPALSQKSVFPFPCPATPSAVNTMAMMNAMGGGAPTPQEMAAAAMQFQSMMGAMQNMQDAMQSGRGADSMMGAMQSMQDAMQSGSAGSGGASMSGMPSPSGMAQSGPGLGQALPKAFAARAAARPPGGSDFAIPAGIRKKFQQG